MGSKILNALAVATLGLYKLLLCMYPRTFREEYGQEMTRVVRDMLHDRERSPVDLWFRLLADTITAALRERSDEMKRSTVVLLAAAVAVGCGIAWVDSRPTWNDTGITAGTLLLSSATFGMASPKTPWLWALAIGIWIPIVEAPHGNSGALIAPVFALVGAYVGAGLRRAFSPPHTPTGDPS